MQWWYIWICWALSMSDAKERCGFWFEGLVDDKDNRILSKAQHHHRGRSDAHCGTSNNQEPETFKKESKFFTCQKSYPEKPFKNHPNIFLQNPSALDLTFSPSHREAYSPLGGGSASNKARASDGEIDGTRPSLLHCLPLGWPMGRNRGLQESILMVF